ncbi:MAG TPA: hypothetical protein V6D20_03730 [Candidatus Obscuribacterales bacterium]
MPELPWSTDGSTILVLAVLHCVIGVTAALVAQRRGRRLGNWLILGLIGGTAALVAACFVPAKRD